MSISGIRGPDVAVPEGSDGLSGHELKRRMLTMITENLHGQALPDDFANRIGRLIEARGNVADALFDPGATPDILTELSISDEVNQRAVNFHVFSDQYRESCAG
jgi:hypothetical protein